MCLSQIINLSKRSTATELNRVIKNYDPRNSITCHNPLRTVISKMIHNFESF